MNVPSTHMESIEQLTKSIRRASKPKLRGKKISGKANKCCRDLWMKILNKTRGKGLSEMSGQFFGLTLEWARIHFFRLYMQRQKQASTKRIKHKHHRTNQVFVFFLMGSTSNHKNMTVEHTWGRAGRNVLFSLLKAERRRTDPFELCC